MKTVEKGLRLLLCRHSLSASHQILTYREKCCGSAETRAGEQWWDCPAPGALIRATSESHSGDLSPAAQLRICGPASV